MKVAGQKQEYEVVPAESIASANREFLRLSSVKLAIEAIQTLWLRFDHESLIADVEMYVSYDMYTFFS